MDSIDVEIIKSKNNDNDKIEDKLKSELQLVLKLRTAYEIFKSINNLNYFTDDEVADYILIGENLEALFESKDKAFWNNLKEYFKKLIESDPDIRIDDLYNIQYSILKALIN